MRRWWSSARARTSRWGFSCRHFLAGSHSVFGGERFVAPAPGAYRRFGGIADQYSRCDRDEVIRGHPGNWLGLWRADWLGRQDVGDLDAKQLLRGPLARRWIPAWFVLPRVVKLSFHEHL